MHTGVYLLALPPSSSQLHYTKAFSSSCILRLLASLFIYRSQSAFVALSLYHKLPSVCVDVCARSALIANRTVVLPRGKPSPQRTKKGPYVCWSVSKQARGMVSLSMPLRSVFSKKVNKSIVRNTEKLRHLDVCSSQLRVVCIPSSSYLSSWLPPPSPSGSLLVAQKWVNCSSSYLFSSLCLCLYYTTDLHRFQDHLHCSVSCFSVL